MLFLSGLRMRIHEPKNDKHEHELKHEDEHDSKNEHEHELKHEDEHDLK